jgi:hypothetical protein
MDDSLVIIEHDNSADCYFSRNVAHTQDWKDELSQAFD